MSAEEDGSEDDESIEDIDQEMNELENQIFDDKASDDEEEMDDEDSEAEDLDRDNEEDDDGTPMFKEDIYGRKVDARTGQLIEGTSAARAMEKLEELNKNSTELAEQRAGIAKTLRGSINRLNESTLNVAIKSLEELFSKNSHNGKLFSSTYPFFAHIYF